MPVVIETFEEFTRRHGEPLRAKNSGHLLFADGATCDGESGNWRVEPPEGPIANCEARYRFCKELVRRLHADYTGFVDGLAGQARIFGGGSGPLPDWDAALAGMKRLKNALRGAQRREQGCESELRVLHGGEFPHERVDREHQERQQQAEEFISRLQTALHEV